MCTVVKSKSQKIESSHLCLTEGSAALRLRYPDGGGAGGPGGGGDGPDALGEAALRERGHDRHAHPESHLLQNHHGAHGGHRMVPPQLRHGRRTQMGQEPRLRLCPQVSVPSSPIKIMKKSHEVVKGALKC